jgi:transcriptional regulator with GAF, ATPase, and Fis domain/pSer/pThr/pTyr-binding forkhead associated (FHA) protein
MTMDPRMVIVSGAKKGMIVRLSDAEATIGRDSTSVLGLSEEAVSRKHCAIQSDSCTHRIVDFNSSNGTFVNGIPVRNKVLQHGDRICVGYTEIVFLLEADETIEPAATPEDEGRTLILSPADRNLVLGSDRPKTVLPDLGTVMRDLNALLRISRINTICKVDLLQRELLDLLFEVIPAARGSVVLTSRDSPGSATSWHRDGRKGGPGEVNWKIVNRALWEGSSVVNEAETSGTKSANDRFVLCVKLTGTKETIGALYLVGDPSVPFEENHAHFVTAVAGIFAVALENAMHLESLEQVNRCLQSDIELENPLVGESTAMDAVTEFITRVAKSDATVLIRGESGTGKELVARAIHRNSPRKDRPFVAINCAAITETLLESELFGHERGAFTGATATKMGRLEVANSGTLFLDEIGEMPLLLQAKVLRAIQTREFERVGGTRSIKVDVRFVAATNRNLEQAMKNGSFRQDLFYRVNVVSINMPPLREHPEDIPLLGMYFAAQHSKKCKRPLKGISLRARALLLNYSWPGNVRELENAIERAVVMGVGDMIVLEDLPEALLESQPEATTGSKYHQSINALKKQMIVEAVERSGGMITEAAKLLGVHPNYLHRLIRNLNLRTLVTRDSLKPGASTT